MELTKYLRIEAESTFPVCEWEDSEVSFDVLIPWTMFDKQVKSIAKKWIGKKFLGWRITSFSIWSDEDYRLSDYSFREFSKKVGD